MSKSPNRKPPPKPGSRPAAAADDRVAQLQRLIEVMVEKDVVEVELEEGDTRWRVRRKDVPPLTFAAPGAVAVPSMPAVASGGSAAAPAAASAGPAKEPQGEVFKSPMLGTFYRAASPEAEPFVKPGDRVSADTTLCIIEAMKVMNEIKAEREFQVLEVLVQNGDPVEFGQPLFTIK
jgi:acetyl-CoA carboxylase biotin carboxyl carrier protein